MKEIEIRDYDYDLPPDRIAQYPANERDKSRLLVYRGNSISEAIFSNIDRYIPSDSLLIFNNTRVIRARLLFRKPTGSSVEILCLEPVTPDNYELSFSSLNPVEWKCIVGNLKKWKKGSLVTSFSNNGKEYILTAERLRSESEVWIIKFSWTCPEISFGKVIEKAGHIPLPPYIERDDSEEDSIRYQTVYSKIDGSVAAPTAGLHFTENVLTKIHERGIRSAEITLHVGAGTFQPVKHDKISGHRMHCEHFFVSRRTIELLMQSSGRIIPVGTTSVRALESLYWLGIKIMNDPTFYNKGLTIGQWEPYKIRSEASVVESMDALLKLMISNNMSVITAATSIIIVPGYKFRMTAGMITNFHQPRSTLLLLVSAWTGDDWRNIYSYALDNGFRFLSYGDSSLLFR